MKAATDRGQYLPLYGYEPSSTPVLAAARATRSRRRTAPCLDYAEVCRSVSDNLNGLA